LSRRMGESVFIEIFDIIFAVALFFIFYWLLKRIIKTNGRTHK
jgi:flagellar biogenesis protein FliO